MLKTPVKVVATEEIYVTDEENFEEYVPRSSYEDNQETEDETSDEELEEEDEEEEEEEDEDSEGFSLHMGEILETHYKDDFTKLDYDADYEGISNSGSVSFPYYTTDLRLVYLGVRTLIRKEWVEETTTAVEDIPVVHMGFFTEESFTDDLVNLKVEGMTKRLDMKYQFEFSQMKRSDILIEVIKTAGLIPVVDPTGLDDDIIDYTNVKSDEEDDSSDTSGVTAASVKELAKKICKGKKTPKAVATAIHSWIAKNIPYPHPNYSNYTYSPEQVIKQGWSNCADRSRLAYQLAKVCGKVKCQIVHTYGHLWVQYNINGKWVDSDPSPSRPNLGVICSGYGNGVVDAYARLGMGMS